MAARYEDHARSCQSEVSDRRPSDVNPHGQGHSWTCAWTTERGHCHQFVYVEDDGRPANCPEPTVTSGWRRDGQGRWYVVDACAQHRSQLQTRPCRAPVMA